jgi:hypothetical protein
MAMAPEAIYAQLSTLYGDKPAIEGHGPYGEAEDRWLAQVYVLVEASGDFADCAAMRVAIEGLHGVLHQQNIRTIKAVLDRTLARLELRLPAAAQGAFIDAGLGFTAFRAVSKVLAQATARVFIVDPYLSQEALFEFVPSAREGTQIQLLCDGNAAKLQAALKTGVDKWRAQYGNTRPLEARVTAAGLLHDRLIIIDDHRAWSLTQSFKDLVARSPASLLPVTPEVAQPKIAAYQDIWNGAQPL